MRYSSPLQKAFMALPNNASEPQVDNVFASGILVRSLGFSTPDDLVGEFHTGPGKVDYALRKTKGDDKFYMSKSQPELLLELKGRDSNLTPGTSDYKDAFNQITSYLRGSKIPFHCWGAITNGERFQLFRKHGKIVYPVTECFKFNTNKIDLQISKIRSRIQSTSRALVVTTYNNKGGVGKTTTVINVAAMLAFKGKKVLVIDFDHNQRDLTNFTKINSKEGTVLELLTERNKPIHECIKQYITSHPRTGRPAHLFDILPADKKLYTDDSDLLKLIPDNKSFRILNDKISDLKSEYDYIIIDAPPGWRLLSQIAVFAADVILIPTACDDVDSLRNAAEAIRKFFPEMREAKEEETPIALPIFFGRGKPTDKQKLWTAKEIINICEESSYDTNKDLNHCLRYASCKAYINHLKYSEDITELNIFSIPSFSTIANSRFVGKPAVCLHKAVYVYFSALVKGCFIDE